MKSKRIIIIIILLAIVFKTIAQKEIKLNKDSIYFFNIEILLKIKILKEYEDNIKIPHYNIDFPCSCFNPKTKTIKITCKDDSLTISDSTIALIRNSEWSDKSYGSGGYDYILQYKDSPFQIVVIF